MGYLEDINASYAQHERQANAALAAGDPQQAHAAHLVMQQLVADRDAYVGAGGGGGGGVPAGPTAEEVARRNSVAAAIRGQFEAWGLGSLASLITQYAQQDYTAEAIAFLLRDTPEYKQRFPAMQELNKQGRGISEAEYIAYENNARAIEQRYGLPENMVYGNVTNLLINDVSAAELQDRAVLSAADSLTAPDDLKNMFKEYYGIDSSGLAAYYFDPNVAVPLLEKRSATARIGVEAARQHVNASLSLAEELQGQGVTESQAKQGFGLVYAQRAVQTSRGETTTQENLTRGVFGDADEAQKTQRILMGRRNRFEGGGQYVSDKTGVSSLGDSGV